MLISAYFAQFTKVTSDEAVTYGVPYDYTSVMFFIIIICEVCILGHALRWDRVCAFRGNFHEDEWSEISGMVRFLRAMMMPILSDKTNL